MANLEKTLDKIGSGIETVLGSSPRPSFDEEPSRSHFRNPNGGQSNVERIGMESRSEHLRRNEWGKYFQYTKTLVESEYDVQKEFMV